MLGKLGMEPDHLIHRFAYMKNEIPVAGVAHQAGTCRFGSDPATSVLDVDCRAHELDNLYVVDTSVFPSIGAVNPALTAMANALRVGDHLLERLGAASADRRGRAPSASRSSCPRATSASWSSRSAPGCARTRSAAATCSTATAPTRWRAPGRGQVLMPWPNRIEDGDYEFARHDSTSCRSASRRRATRSTGSCAGCRGRSPSVTRSRVVLEHALHPQPGYPFSLALSVEYALPDERPRASRRRATNVGAEPCPFGSGAHPYLTRRHRDRWTASCCACPAAPCCEVDDRGLPIGAGPVEGTEYDFRTPRPIGSTVSTTRSPISSATTTGAPASSCRTRTWHRRDALARRELPVPEALHRRPAAQRRAPEPRGRADDLPAERVPDRRGLIVLEPGESTTARWGIQEGAPAR